MKPNYLNQKSAIKLLIAVAITCILIVGCKKDSSIGNTNADTLASVNHRVSAVATDEIVSAARISSNQAPRAKAGNDQTITLPANLNLDGSGSSDADGSIASYQWTEEVGPVVTIASPASAQTAVTGLISGSYRFRLTVTDNKGATGTDTVHVTINGTGTGTNQSPTVNAGADQTITLPVSSVSLSGTALDPDGTIASYLWTKVSGSGGTITTATAATTTITGLTAGTYSFSLKVTDNLGATATDNITITVNAATNQSPTVNAGADQTITLPVSLVTLNGTGSDPDGIITSYLWSKVSGSGGTLSSTNTAATTVSGLTAGSYVFSLKVTDNAGGAATDNVTVTVNSATQGGTGYTLTYSNGYNTSLDISSNQLGRGGLSTSLYNVGPGSFRSEVRAGDDPISSGWRSEQQYDGAEQNPTEGAVEYDVYYENWGGFDGGGHSIQWHPVTSGGSAIVSLQNYSGKFDVTLDYDGTVYHESGTLKTCASNTWYHLRWEFKWSTGTDGYVRLFVDGVQTFNYSGQSADGSGQYLKVGQNRWPSGSGNMLTTSVCYYDNLKIYKKG